MDGNLYLIKLVKKRPVLWDKNFLVNRDPEARNVAWREIAGTIGVEMDWIRSRWYNLRERFVKELKQCYNEKQQSKFKYFHEMLFLSKYVEFRKKPDGNFDKFIKQLPREDIHLQNKVLGEDKTCEFIITQKEIEETEDTDPDIIFMELSEDESKINEVNDFKESNVTTTDAVTMKVVNTQSGLQQICDSTGEEELSRCSSKVDVANNSENIETEPSTTLNKFSNEIDHTYIESTSFHESPTPFHEEKENNSESRCEDTIFGELVTAMLKKMGESKKKSVKKEIINILLS